MPADPPSDPVWRRTVARATASGDAAALPLRFRAGVLERYLERPDNRILRSDTIGRLLRPGKPVLDFGIVGEEREIHIRFADLAQIVPEDEREHWLDHLIAPQLSRTLLKMQLTPGACHDDGPLRDWRPEPTC